MRERERGEIVYGFKMYRHYFNYMKADLSCTFKNYIYICRVHLPEKWEGTHPLALTPEVLTMRTIYIATFDSIITLEILYIHSD